MRKELLACLCFLMVIASACAPTKKVSRVDENKQIDLSGRWNDTDSRLVSEEMVKDVLSRPWLTEFSVLKSKKPIIIVGLVKNKTSEHISTEAFIKDIEREFINSGKVKVVQSATAREELRDERGDQQTYASDATVKKWGQELGADFILQGTVNSISDADGRTKLVYYQTDLELSNLETNEKVWLGTKKIKKVVK